jgi:hypothetical protein
MLFILMVVRIVMNITMQMRKIRINFKESTLDKLTGFYKREMISPLLQSLTSFSHSIYPISIFLIDF